MAKPTIDGVTVEPSTIAPGETATVTVNAHDPDSVTATLDAQVTDTDGEQANTKVTLTIQDAITYDLVDVDGVGFTIEQDASKDNVFLVTAPAG